MALDLYMACGSIVHSALENAHRTFLDSHHSMDLETLQKTLPDLWKQALAESPIPIDESELAPFLQKSMDNVSWYYQNFFSKEKEATIAVEKRLMYPLNPQHKQWLIGFVDRISQPSDDVIIVHDYKTGSKKLSEKSLATDFQAQLYGAMVAHTYSARQRIELHWHYLSHQKTVKSELEPENVRNAVQKAQMLANAVESHKQAQLFPTKKGWQCSRCDFVSVCPAQKGALITTK